MTDNPKDALRQCKTLMLDMDGTILDLAFDNFMWLTHVPEQYAVRHSIDPDEARNRLYAKFREMQGSLEWYCLDHWSEFLNLDVAGLHRAQNHRIGYLPGAEDFLKTVREYDIRLLLVTNSHLETLDIKDEVTGITQHFDGIYSSHSFRVPKEHREFWQGLQEAEGFDPETTLFVDDTTTVLDSARDYGVSMLLEITHPDTTRDERTAVAYPGITGLRELV